MFIFIIVFIVPIKLNFVGIWELYIKLNNCDMCHKKIIVLVQLKLLEMAYKSKEN